MATETNARPEESLVTSRTSVLNADPASLRIPGRPGRFTRYEPTVIGVGSVLGFLVVWQAIAAARIVPPLFLPGPLDILEAFAGLFRQGAIWNDIWVSARRSSTATGWQSCSLCRSAC